MSAPVASLSSAAAAHRSRSRACLVTLRRRHHQQQQHPRPVIHHHPHRHHHHHQQRCRNGGGAAARRLPAQCAFADPGGAAAAGGGGDAFPRIKERDPYKRLGVSREATSEEISEARAYLLESYQHDQASVEAIEAAYDKIISEKLRSRRKSKIQVGGLDPSSASESGKPRSGLSRRLAALLHQPSRPELVQRSVLYIFLAAWSVVNAAEGGPAFQLAVALGLCIYFQYQRNKSAGLLRPFATTLIGLFLGWIVGSIVPIYLPVLFPPALAPETICALFAMVFFWFFATFLK